VHPQGDPEDLKCTIHYVKYIANFLRNPAEFFKDERNQRLLILSIFIILFLCLLIFLTNSARGEKEIVSIDDVTATPVLTRPTITPTKWWIKTTFTSSPIPSEFSTTIHSRESTDGCSTRFSSLLKTDIYAYISLTPPLPNRVRSGPSLTDTYVGQIEPGGGLKVIDGPFCADGYSWWRVESRNGDLQGWTVEGNSSEQWVLACPHEGVACSHTADSVSANSTSKNENNKERSEDVCKSNNLAVGMLAQVGQDSLLAVRFQPDIGEIKGRAGPTSIVKIVEGPTCVGNAVWWKVNVFDLNLVGWAIEKDLYACPKDSECNLWPS
jgi:hypothetical protein